MEFRALSTTTTTSSASTIVPSPVRFFIPAASILQVGRLKCFPFHRKPQKFITFASKDDPKLDQWDQMELKVGRLIGEDPKLTLAKIMGRKSNPDLSYLEIEKLYRKKGSAIDSEEEEVPFEVAKKGQPSNSLDELALSRPMPKDGIKFEASKKQIELEVKKSNQPTGMKAENAKAGVPDIILRKPSLFNEDNVGSEKSSRLRMKPNLSLRLGSEQPKQRFSDITLLKKPEPVSVAPNMEKNQEISGGFEANDRSNVFLSTHKTEDASLLEKPEMMNLNLSPDPVQESSRKHNGSSSQNDVTLSSSRSSDLSSGMVTRTEINSEQFGHENVTGLQPLEQNNLGCTEKNTITIDFSEITSVHSKPRITAEAALQGKPKRLDQSIIGTPNVTQEDTVRVSPESYENADELENFLATSPIKEHEDSDWTRAEDLIQTEGRVEVELLSSSTRGFVVSFGSLIGFLPYRNLSAKWKFLAFESWLRRKGLDPSKYKQNFGIAGAYESMSIDTQFDQKFEGDVSADMKLEDLLRIYNQEKIKFLSSFVGQKIKVSIILADRKSRRLIFSVRPKEKEELVEKKRSVMSKLNIGDVVKCHIKKITYFGIFVEVEGVPALIHQTEVSWDATLDAASHFKIGQIVEAKVYQLDFSLQRIFLSLKEILPDPLTGALEAVVGNRESSDDGGKLEATQTDAEWAEVDLLIRELQLFEGIGSVSKGRFFLGPGLAPTFQVYMASMFENQYKLLARSGNRIQELIVQTSLDKEEMKSAILTCTSRVV